MSQTGGHGDSRMRQDEPMDGCCGHNGDMVNLVDGVPQVIQAARERMRQGAQHVKVNSETKDWN